MKPTALVAALFLIVNASLAMEQKTLDPLILDGRTLRKDSLKSEVLTDTDLEEYGASSLGEVLEQLPGLDFRTNASGLTDVSIRGSRAQHVLVLIDGVRVNDPGDPSRTFDFSRLNPDLISKIEVIKGAGSVAYGADALSGVMLITTKHKRGVSANIEGGSYSTFRTSLSARENLTPELSPWIDIGYETLTGPSQAYVPTGDLDVKKNLSGKAGIQIEDLDKTFLTEISGSYNQVKQDLDSGPFADNPVYTSESAQTTYEGRLRKNWNDSQTTHIHASYLQTKRTYENPIAVAANFEPTQEVDTGSSVQAEAEHHFSFPLNAKTSEFILGAEGVWEQLEIDSTLSGQSFYPVHQHTYGGFGQSKLPLFPAGDLTLGLRGSFTSENETALTERVSYTHTFNPGTTLDFSFGTGFKTPSLFQLYSPDYGNSKLNSERSTSYTITFQTSLLEMAVFQNEYTDLITGDPKNNYRSLNINRATTKGAEASVTLPLSGEFTLTPNYTYLHTEEGSSGNPIPGRPKHKGGFRLQYKPTTAIEFQSEVLGKSSRFEGSGSPMSTGYVLVNFSGQYHFSADPKITLHFRIENAFDHSYMEKRGYSSPGIGAYAGLRVRL